MNVDTETKNRLVLERLLADFAAQLNGAVDFWTVVCLGSVPVKQRDFILNKADRLRSTLVAITNVASSNLGQKNWNHN